MGARGLRLADARTVRVTARLQTGVVLPTRFPAPLDGIIAAQVRRDRLGDNYWTEAATPSRELLERDPHGRYIPQVRAYRDRLRHWPLPLVRIKPRGVPNSQWVWAATCAVPDNTDNIDVRYVHKRFDTAAAEQRVDRLPANTDVGVLKPWRIPVPVTVCSTVTWWALGDPTGIERVVTRVDAIGKHTRSGEGAVLDWHVEDLGPADVDAIRWLPDGTITRPYPPTYATWLGITGQPELTLVDAYRPPYWRPPQTAAGGGFARQPRKVIAPWTTKPSPCTAA